MEQIDAILVLQPFIFFFPISILKNRLKTAKKQIGHSTHVYTKMKQ